MAHAIDEQATDGGVQCGLVKLLVKLLVRRLRLVRHSRATSYLKVRIF